MGMVGKGIVVLIAVGAVVGYATDSARKANVPSGPLTADVAEGRCADRIGSRLPSGAFIVMHTPADAAGRSNWVLDRGGMREYLSCTAGPGAAVTLAAMGHD